MSDEMKTTPEPVCSAAVGSDDGLAHERPEPTKEQLLSYLERAGWGPCNIPACNCTGWHQLRSSQYELQLESKLSDLRQKIHAARGLLVPLGNQITPSVLAIREAINILR